MTKHFYCPWAEGKTATMQEIERSFNAFLDMVRPVMRVKKYRGLSISIVSVDDALYGIKIELPGGEDIRNINFIARLMARISKCHKKMWECSASCQYNRFGPWESHLVISVKRIKKTGQDVS